MTTQLRKLAEIVTDAKVIVGVLFTIIGIVVWVAISWTSLLERVGAVEESQEETIMIRKTILEQLNSFKTEQAVQGEQITAIQNKSNDTNNLVKELLRIFKQ